MRFAAWGVLACVVFSGRIAHAACDGKRPWVTVRMEGESSTLQERVKRQLAAGLRDRGIDVCESAPGSPVARISFAQRPEQKVAIAVTAEDAITDKTVSRSVDLSRLPDDAWPLALAVAADEILRASWAELVLESAPKPKQPVPEAVEQSVRRDLRPEVAPSEPRWSVAAAAVADAYGGGARQLGVDARVSFRLGSRTALRLAAGLRAALPQQAPNGEVYASSTLLALGPSFGLTSPGARFRVELGAWCQVARVEYRANAVGAARDESGAATGVSVRGGPTLGWTPDPALLIFADLGLGAAIRPTEALDDGQVVMGHSGLVGSLALGIAGLM